MAGERMRSAGSVVGSSRFGDLRGSGGAPRRCRAPLRAPVTVAPVPWAVLALLAVLALVGAAGCAGDLAPAGATTGIKVIAPADRVAAPALRGDLVDGSGTFDLADHSGDLVVVNFWASWCGPCVAEADDLEQTYLATKDDGVTFLGVNTRDEQDKARSFLVGRATYPSVFDPAGRLALGFSIPPAAIPSTLILDRQGRVAVVIHKAVLRGGLEPLVTQLAAESS